jgi:hypothetical protein
VIDRDGRLERLLGDWVVWSARHARLVAGLSFVFLVPLAWFAWTHLRVDADTGNLVSDQLPWRQAHAALERTFPHLLEDMQIVIDARTPEIAAEAQRLLARDLASRTDVFSFVYAAGGDDFFQRHGLLFSSAEELEDLRARMRDYGSGRGGHGHRRLGERTGRGSDSHGSRRCLLLEPERQSLRVSVDRSHAGTPIDDG